MSQLVNPYKYTIYPGFYESCGPEGEKLIEYVEKEWKKQPHVGEMPLDIVAQVIEHGDKAVAAIDKAAASVSSNKDEFARLQNDMHCYREFAYAFNLKVKAAKLVLDYQWGKEIKNLEEAIPLMEQSLEHYRKLVERTNNITCMPTVCRQLNVVFLSVEMMERIRLGKNCWYTMRRNWKISKPTSLC